VTAIPPVVIRRSRMGVVTATPIRLAADRGEPESGIRVTPELLAVLLKAAGEPVLAAAAQMGLGAELAHVRRVVAAFRAGIAVPGDVEPGHWTVGMAAKLLCVDASTCRRWLVSGRLAGRQERERGVWSVEPSSVRAILAVRD
jgi:hypothetical protein